MFGHVVLSALVKAPAFPADRVTSAIVRTMRATGAVGVSVAVVSRGAVVYERGLGRRAIGGRPVDGNTRFEIGSLTKQFTAAAILQLAERGKLAIDDRLSKYLPHFPHAAQMTLHELLNQTSGLPDFMETNHFMKLSHSTPGSFSKIERMASGPLHFTPGTQWEYSNTNYVALGRIVEIVSGERFDDYVRRHLFAAAGMRDSDFVAGEADRQDVARGYWRGMSGKDALSPAPATVESWAFSAGDIVSTADDVAHWDIALQSGKVVSRSGYARMTRPGKLASGKVDDYAFHWWTDPLHGHRLLSGLGDTYGSSSCNDVFPDDGLAIIVLENMAVTPDGHSDAAAGIASAIFRTLVPS